MSATDNCLSREDPQLDYSSYLVNLNVNDSQSRNSDKSNSVNIQRPLSLWCHCLSGRIASLAGPDGGDGCGHRQLRPVWHPFNHGMEKRIDYRQ